MFTNGKVQQLNDFFAEANSRPKQSIYFYRIVGYNEEIKAFIQKYYEYARQTGVIIEGKIPNPNEQQLSYYEEMMGMQFQMDVSFFMVALQKWLPRMNLYQRQNVANAMYDALETLRKNGKTEYMLKNAYIKFMCWLYYKFERIVGQLGEKKIPKILYEGDVNSYELILLSILSNAGCDVVLLQYQGDSAYLKTDASSFYSQKLDLPNMKAFPQGFCLKQLREEQKSVMQKERLYGKLPQFSNCTNVWMEGIKIEETTSKIYNGNLFSEVQKNMTQRGTDSRFFYTCYCKINGVEDKLTYLNELYQFQLALKNKKRSLVILEEQIPLPTMEEIAEIKRKNYTSQEEMLIDMAGNLRYASDLELQAWMRKTFVEIMTEQATQNVSLNKLTNQAVYMVCWLKRYQAQLFSGYNINIGCFLYLGTCKNANEALFVKLLARLPIDVLLFNPNLEQEHYLEDALLYEIHYTEQLFVKAFPQESADIHIGTAAYYAERELDTLLYQNTGMYRNHQYEKANTIILQTMYEEIKILWNEELKYRQGFSTEHEQVTLPVIFAKISGVKNGMVSKYWTDISELITEDTIVVKNISYIEQYAKRKMNVSTTEFFRNGKVQKQKIKANPNYPYGVLREEIQEYILEKLQTLIDKRLIKGTFENGMEYKIVSTVLNLPKEIVRLIQKFDFTKKNPKMIYINSGEQVISLEDTIMTAFLHLVGFDILFFVPTGYQSVEKYWNSRLMEEHQIGEYLYDLQIPNLSVGFSHGHTSWMEKLLGKIR